VEGRDFQEYLDVLGFDSNSCFQQSSVKSSIKLPQLTPSSGEEEMNTSSHPNTLAQLEHLALECRNCSLCESRSNVVFGEGSPKARLLFIGEAPDESEDRNARPFVSEAGDLLDKMIVAMGLKREQVYITNVVKCRPENDRTPQEEELSICSNYLSEQIQIISPDVIVCLGTVASQSVLKSKTSISQLRGKFVPHPELKNANGEAVAVMPTFHPEYLLKSPSEKKHAWEDLQKVMKRLAQPQ